MLPLPPKKKEAMEDHKNSPPEECNVQEVLALDNVGHDSALEQSADDQELESEDRGKKEESIMAEEKQRNRQEDIDKQREESRAKGTCSPLYGHESMCEGWFKVGLTHISLAK